MMKLCFVVLFSSILIACDNSYEPINKKNTSHLKLASQANQIKDYKAARPIFWASVYPEGGETLYCGEPFGDEHPKNYRSRKGFNIEHVFPMSWATNGLNCGKRKQCRVGNKVFNQIEADLHNLFPSRADVNQDRSSFRFGNVGGESRHYGNQCDFEVSNRDRVAEPAPSKRGEVARAMFYMADRYKSDGLVLFKKQALLLEKWHRSDPPSDEERRRNNVIEKLQGNRNVFIDSPDKVHLLIQGGHFFN